MQANTLEEIKLKKGSSVDIPLKGLSTAGYEWNYSVDGDTDSVSISKDFGNIEKSPKKNTGANADEIFTITAQKRGIAAVVFTQKRSWEKNANAADQKKVKIIVED
jgi:predicted secreted protein